jgi:hypothetical protein
MDQIPMNLFGKLNCLNLLIHKVSFLVDTIYYSSPEDQSQEEKFRNFLLDKQDPNVL